MKYLFLSLVFSLVSPLTPSALAKDAKNTKNILVACQIQNFANCATCKDRVPASCMGHEYVGSLPLTLKPNKIEWQVTNTKNGSEQRLTVENKSLSLSDIKSANDLKSLAAKQKVKVSEGDTVSLLSVHIPIQTKLYKSHEGTETMAAMIAPSGSRGIASVESPAPAKGIFAGGVKRAQQLKEKK